MKEFEDEYYERGEAVLHKLTGWLGIVTGERNGGTLFDVVFIHSEINGGLPFNLCVDGALLEPFDDDKPPTTAREDNVVHVDFTKKPKGGLKKAEPQGAA